MKLTTQIILFNIIATTLCYSSDLIMVTTSLKKKDTGYIDTANEYKDIVLITDNIVAEYIEVDSMDCLNTYGVRAEDPTDVEVEADDHCYSSDQSPCVKKETGFFGREVLMKYTCEL